MKTTHTYRDYVFTIEYHPEDLDFEVDFPDFPSIITAGWTLEEAFSNACEALDLALETLRDLGRDIPPPSKRIHVVPA